MAAMTKSTLHLEFRGNKEVILLQLLNSLVLRGHGTLHRVLESCTLKFLHLKKENRVISIPKCTRCFYVLSLLLLYIDA